MIQGRPLPKTPLRRTPMKRHPKRQAVRTPPEVYQEVCLRSGGEWIDGRCGGGLCEECRSSGDWRGLQFAHWFKHRKMGGTRDPSVHSAENVRRVCARDHDKKDGRSSLNSESVGDGK